MPQLIKNGAVSSDDWQLVEKDSNDITQGQVIIPLALWLAEKDQLQARSSEIGVWLDSDDELALLADDISSLSLIAINFPSFMDGRGFSQARLLRERYGFTGDIRAIGNFIRDQLCYLKRCGVSSFQPTAGAFDLEKALDSLDDFSDGYQASADQPVPLFQRRA